VCDGCPLAGITFDITTSRFSATVTYAGLVASPDRAALAAANTAPAPSPTAHAGLCTASRPDALCRRSDSGWPCRGGRVVRPVQAGHRPAPAARGTPSSGHGVDRGGVCVLAGARNFREVGDRAADLPPLLLDAAGARCDPRTGDLVAPSGSRLRRVVEDIDADAMDRLVCQWLANRACPRRGTGDEAPGQHRRGIAMDGKVVRKSGAGRALPAGAMTSTVMLSRVARKLANTRIAGQQADPNVTNIWRPNLANKATRP